MQSFLCEQPTKPILSSRPIFLQQATDFCDFLSRIARPIPQKAVPKASNGDSQIEGGGDESEKMKEVDATKMGRQGEGWQRKRGVK